MNDYFSQEGWCGYCFLLGEPKWVFTTHHVNDCSANDKDKLELSQEVLALMDFVRPGAEQGVKSANQHQPSHVSLHKGIQPQGQTSPLCPILGAASPRTHPLVGSITPIPSLFLRVSLGSHRFDITLDGGATVSFITLQLARSLNLPIKPNGELARLADKRFRIQSQGEVDFCVVEVSTKVALRVRALVMENLAVDCYGGTTFQFDNYIVPDIVTSTVHMHGFKYSVTLPPKQPFRAYPPPSMQSTHPTPPSTSPTTSQPVPVNACRGHPLEKVPKPNSASGLEAVGPQSIVMKTPKSLNPQGTYAIPVKNFPKDCPVLVCPPTPSTNDAPELSWPPQICNVISNSAIYVNETSSALCHSKGAHFRIIPMAPCQDPPALSPTDQVMLSAASKVPQPPPSKLLSKIRINVDILTPQQLERLHSLHSKHSTAFLLMRI